MRATVTRATPSRAPAATPTQGGAGYLDAHLNMTPSISRKLFSPVVPTSIGPTPQRDGRVLGLFDVLNEEEEKRKKRNSIAATPSKRTAAEAEAAAAAAQGAGNNSLAVPTSTALLGATPRKQTLNIDHYKSDDDEDEDSTINARRLGRTPMSSGRRNLLNHFTAGGNIPAAFTAGSETKTTRDSSGVLGTTPLKPRNNDNQNYMTQQQLLTTPSKGSGDNSTQPFATPAFLRRTSSALPPVDENGEFMSPPTRLRLPRKPLVRGLSSVLASLRKAEDEQLDEQLDVLRDLENGMDMNAPPPTSKPKPKIVAPAASSAAPAAPPAPQRATTAGLAEGVQVEDSQLQDPHEQELQELEQYEQELGPEESQEHPRLLGGFDDEGLYDSEPEEQIGRDGQPLRVYKKKGQKRTTRRFNIRPTRTKRPAPGTMADEASGSEDEDSNEVEGDSLAPLSGSEFGSDAEDDGGSGKVKKTVAKKSGTEKKKAADKPDGPVKKAVRKVNELAHANFKRLKLRNKGSKGGPGLNSRFRRKR